MRNDRRFAVSAQQIDPLSWFTGPLVPLSFAALTAVYGVASIAFGPQTGLALLQPAALALIIGADILIHLATRPTRPPLRWPVAGAAVVMAGTAVMLSAWGYAGQTTPLGQWWAPAAFALTYATLGPYLPVRQLLALGLYSLACAVLGSFLVGYPVAGDGPVTLVLVATYPLVVSIAATASFSYIVVNTMAEMLEHSSRLLPGSRYLADEEAEMATVARLTARASPFLERIAAAGRIEPADRALAGQLARRLRDELVTQSRLTWLDSIAGTSRLVVVDPEQLARRMKSPQRTALRAMLQAVLDIPATDSRSLMIELRKAPDGTIAVGVSIDMALPEGTRIMHLAPYYLTLQTAVHDLAVTEDRLGLTFRVESGD